MRTVGQSRVLWEGYYGRRPYLEKWNRAEWCCRWVLKNDVWISANFKFVFQMAGMCLYCDASLQEFEYWWWDLAMVSTQGFYIRKVRRPPPSYQIYFSHWLCARTSHCPNSTATVSKSPSSHNATRSESTNWWSYMPDLARDSPPSSSHRPIKPSGSTRETEYIGVPKRLTFRGMLVLSPVYEIVLSRVISRFGGGTCCTIVVWGAVWFSTA